MVEIGKEFFIFIYAILSGVFVMLCYQLLQLLRSLILHKFWMINVEDIIFWLLVSVYLFRQMYVTTNGNVRWFFVIGIFIGGGLTGFIHSIGKRIYLKTKKNLEKEKKRR